MKKVLLFILIIVLTGNLHAQNYDFYIKTNYVNIYYKITDSSISNRSVEVAWTPESYYGNITIPSTVTYNGKKYKVTGIGDKAFLNATNVTSLTLPNSITYIGKSGIYNTGITTITLPESVIWLEEYALSKNSLLETVSFPNSIERVGQAAFFLCPNLTHSIYNDKLYAHYAGKEETCIIPEGITTISTSAVWNFLSSINANKIILPSTLQSLSSSSIIVENLNSIEIKATTPPSCPNDAIQPASLTETITIYVSDADPAILERYKADPYWSQFNIVATDLSDDDPKVRADVNGDSVINAADVVSIYNYIISGEESSITKDKADVNEDDDVNAADVVSVYNYITTGEQ